MLNAFSFKLEVQKMYWTPEEAGRYLCQVPDEYADGLAEQWRRTVLEMQDIVERQISKDPLPPRDWIRAVRSIGLGFPKSVVQASKFYLPPQLRRPIATHGNRVIAALVFGTLPAERLGDPAFDIETVASQLTITQVVDELLELPFLEFGNHHFNSIISTVFKKPKKV